MTPAHSTRKQTGLDWDDIDILLRRSTDGGKAWPEPQTLPHPEGKLKRNPAALANAELARRAPLVREGQIAFNNPVAIADRGGAVHFLYCVDYYRCFYLRSDDDGITFRKPVEITSTFTQFRKDYDCQVFATGPAHGIQLKNGRLVVPVWLSTGKGNNAHHPTVVATIYSDDRGKTWPVARVLEPGASAYSDLAVGPDGTIYCLYERGSTDGKDHFATRALTLARFNLEWLAAGKDTLTGPRR